MLHSGHPASFAARQAELPDHPVAASGLPGVHPGWPADPADRITGFAGLLPLPAAP